MPNRIWDGRCEDCYDDKSLLEYEGDLIPAGMKAELCLDCINRRAMLKQHRENVPEIGLLIDGAWVDLPPIAMLVGTKRMTVEVKFLSNSENAGITRLRFNSAPQWFTAGVHGTTPNRALSEARYFLKTFYFPHQPIQFI